MIHLMHIHAAWSTLLGRGHRQRLPQRRHAETIKFEHAGFKIFATASRFPNGGVAEVFLSSAKAGTGMQYVMSDAAVCMSLALQYGCPADVLLAAMTRDTDGKAVTAMAVALERFHG